MINIRKITPFNRNRHYMARYREIITVLIKNGFGDLILNSGLEKYIDIRKIFSMVGQNTNLIMSTNQRIKKVLEELGPTFIKFGQIMANRPDLLPEDLILELAKLQDNVEPFSSDEARKLVEKELDGKIDNLFLEFDSEPIASASIAQVHRAILLDKSEVAIKIQRPNLDHIISTDLIIMTHFAQLLEKHVEGMKDINLLGIIAEFDSAIKEEIDFSIEKRNIERFRQNFKKNEHCYVPKIYRNYCTKKIFTMEFIDGIPFTQHKKFQEYDLDNKQIITEVVDLVMKQIFEDGFFHADPHPGNVFYLPKKKKVCFLDFGMMGKITPENKKNLSNIVVAFVSNDSKKIVRSAVKLSSSTMFDIDDYATLEREVSLLIDEFSYLSLSEINMGEIVSELLNLLIKHKLKIDPSLYLLGKAVVTLEGLCRTIDPEYNLMEHMQPWAKKLVRNEFKPWQQTKSLYSYFSDLILWAKDFPIESMNILEQIKQGKMKIEFEHKGLEPIMDRHDQIMNRVVVALILSSILIGSSIIVHSGMAPTWNGVPIIGVLGYLIAFVLGIAVLFSILHHGKM